jgi:hypothetical protein
MKTLLSAFLALICLTPALAQITIFGRGHSWQVLSPSSDPRNTDADFVATWQTFDGSYNGPAFSNLTTPMAYGTIDGFAGLTVSAMAAPASGSRFTAYIKTQFTLEQDAPLLVLEALLDDGAVIYLDGSVVARPNMTLVTSDNHTDLTDGVGDEANYSSISLGSVSAGAHTLAISLHNQSATSSDLGFDSRLLAVNPPLVRLDVNGMVTETPTEGATTGFSPSPSNLGAWSMVGTGGGALQVLASSPIASPGGQLYFLGSVICQETSATSNFEDNDELRIRLELTDTFGQESEIELIPSDLDLNGDFRLTGAEFTTPGTEIEYYCGMHRTLIAPIPTNTATIRVVVLATNDSGSESFRISDFRITDWDPAVDTDGDGSNDGNEYLNFTSRTDPSDYFRATGVVRGLGTQANPTMPTVTVQASFRQGRRYNFELSPDGVKWDFVGSLTPTANITGIVVPAADPITGAGMPRCFVRCYWQR